MWIPAFDAQMFPPREALLVTRFDGASVVFGNDLLMAKLEGVPTGRIANVGILVYRLYIPRNALVGAPGTTWRLFILENYDRSLDEFVRPFHGYDVQTKTWDEVFCPRAVRYSDINGGHMFMASVPHDGLELPRKFTLAIVSADDFEMHAADDDVKIRGFGGLSDWSY